MCSTLGLCQLVAAERSSLSQLIVKGDMVIKPETRNGELTPHFPRLSVPNALTFLNNDCSHNYTLEVEAKYVISTRYRGVIEH